MPGESTGAHQAGRPAGARVALRCDARWASGAGHLMRCRALASALRARGAEPRLFLDAPTQISFDEVGAEVVASDGAIETRIAEWLDTGKTAVVIDHYDLDADAERAASQVAAAVVVLEDLPDRVHHCDVLVDTAPDASISQYIGRVPDRCRLLLGSSFALLRESFLSQPDAARDRTNGVSGALVTIGMEPEPRVLEMVAAALETSSLPDLSVRAIVPRGGHRRWVPPSATRHTYDVLDRTEDMPALMAAADFAVLGAGSTCLEACFMGLPSVCVVVADNQLGNARALARLGVCDFVDVRPDSAGHDHAADAELRSALGAMADARTRQQRSDAGRNLVDGLGPQRIADALAEIFSKMGESIR